jgi:hypothetical protein
MRARRIALTGPAAAALHGLDGYRNQSWPLTWCVPATTTNVPGAIRTRRWLDPVEIGAMPVAPVSTVLRHLHVTERRNGMSAVERAELALEHALRLEAVEAGDLSTPGSRCPGDRLLSDLLRRRDGEPPTESYAETRAVQLVRSLGYRCWRQVPILDRSTVVHRVDLVLPFRRLRRPDVLIPGDGLLVEIDSREFHERSFERDHRRQSTYDRLGHPWVSFTPTQVERDRRAVAAVLARRMER